MFPKHLFLCLIIADFLRPLENTHYQLPIPIMKHPIKITTRKEW